MHGLWREVTYLSKYQFLHLQCEDDYSICLIKELEEQEDINHEK
jgi:hypothetical protein